MSNRRFATSVLPLIAIAAAGALASACDQDPTRPGPTPTVAAVAGHYTAAESFGALTFTTTEDGVTTDWLAAGAELTLTLNANGTSAGRLFIPGGDEDGGDMDEDMAGTWTLTGSIVRFEQDADTFVRDMDFVYIDGTLTGEETFGAADPSGGTRVRVVLVQQ